MSVGGGAPFPKLCRFDRVSRGVFRFCKRTSTLRAQRRGDGGDGVARKTFARAASARVRVSRPRGRRRARRERASQFSLTSGAEGGRRAKRPARFFESTAGDEELGGGGPGVARARVGDSGAVERVPSAGDVASGQTETTEGAPRVGERGIDRDAKIAITAEQEKKKHPKGQTQKKNKREK